MPLWFAWGINLFCQYGISFGVVHVRANLYFEPACYRCSNLPGSIMMPFSKPKTPSTAIPSNRKGRVSIQKTGYNTKAKIANGQQSINRMIQAMNVNIG
jgi:hypothetical protein